MAPQFLVMSSEVFWKEIKEVFCILIFCNTSFHSFQIVLIILIELTLTFHTIQFPNAPYAKFKSNIKYLGPDICSVSHQIMHLTAVKHSADGNSELSCTKISVYKMFYQSSLLIFTCSFKLYLISSEPLVVKFLSTNFIHSSAVLHFDL